MSISTPTSSPSTDSFASVPVTELLPHRGLMLRLDALTGCADGAWSGRFAITPDDPFLEEDGTLAQEALIESAAQTIAAAQGWAAREVGKPPPEGMLIGMQSFVFHRAVRPGETVVIDACRDMQKSSLLIAKCLLSVGEDVIAEGLLKFYVAVGE